MTGDSTGVIRAGHGIGNLVRTVGPPIQKGSTVLMPDAASLYDTGKITYGRGGLGTQEALIGALAELEGAAAVRLLPLRPGGGDRGAAGGAEGG